MKATSPEPLALHLLSDDERRLTDADHHFINSTITNCAGQDLIDQHLAPEPKPLSVAGHHEWRESLSTPRPFDEVDALVEEIRQAEFEGKGAKP